MDTLVTPEPNEPTQKKRMSLRTQVSISIAAIAFAPNLLILLYFIFIKSDSTENNPQVFLPIVLMTLAGILSSVFVGLFLSRSLLRSLTNLESDIRELTSQRSVALESDPQDPTEVMHLRESFSDLLESLTTEQSRRSAFMATLMHDLKTPIIASNHLLTILRDLDLPSEERKKITTQIIEENSRLLNLVQQMVDAHKFERDGVTLSLDQVDLTQLAQQVVERLKGRTPENIKLELSGSGIAEADSRALDRALTNLIDNALRYAKHRVRVTIEDHQIRVFDDGPGLPKSLDDLAQPFNAQPVSIAGQQYTAGTGGLGLYIIRRIAEAHGGTLEHEPTLVGTALVLFLK